MPSPSLGHTDTLVMVLFEDRGAPEREPLRMASTGPEAEVLTWATAAKHVATWTMPET